MDHVDCGPWADTGDGPAVPTTQAAWLMAYRGLLDLRSWDVPRGIITVNNPPATMPRVTLLLGLTLCRAATPEHDDPGMLASSP